MGIIYTTAKNDRRHATALVRTVASRGNFSSVVASILRRGKRQNGASLHVGM